MSRSYTVKGSFTNQSGARPRRQLQDNRTEPSQQGFPDDSSPSQEPKQPENERYQSRQAYTVIAPNEERRQKLIAIQQKEEEEARMRKEAKGKTPIKLQPKSVGGCRESKREFIEHQQKVADKSPTARALEMRAKREKWRKNDKEREDREIAKKKAEARLQAERNEKKCSLQKETVRRYWDEKYSNESTGRLYREPHSSEEDDDYEPSGFTHFQTQTEDSLVQLCQMFPDYDPKLLSELLQEQGSVKKVCQMLEG